MSNNDYKERCAWCGTPGLGWVIDNKTKRWMLVDESGKKHVHQPSKHEKWVDKQVADTESDSIESLLNAVHQLSKLHDGEFYPSVRYHQVERWIKLAQQGAIFSVRGREIVWRPKKETG